ncbi:MAG: DEAD/DEAH box helicase family protein [Acidimicrobiales bacterium]
MLARDAWLDVLQRFVHVDPVSGTIFPRFHQWDAVRALEAAARAEGPGHDYLVQHSAGSGKSNTIAWLAHRLASLHDEGDAKVFDKVVVITDRRVLDAQLQRTIYQFEHAHGVVQKIDVDSAQLAEALTGASARIVITTLQKFPFVLRHTEDAPSGRFAVIVDEAHSSQTGETAKDLKLVLGGGPTDEAHQLTAAEEADAGVLAEPLDPVGDALARAAGARMRQRNLSFFAFTATPKGRTLELFGRRGPGGRHEPFHLYSMRQAIEEGFILDVLAGYVTYSTYWNIERAVEDDPELDPSKARAAIARFVSLHESNLAQKAEVIVEHYRTHVRHRIGGRAKAMVVTASRLHAVRYRAALKAYCDRMGYGDIGVLVAFSGTVDDGGDVTEPMLNGFPESRTASEFDTDANHLLVVAEKYQTGFDQPLLYAMYVDKALTGLAAVQTLSRLNRTYERDSVVKDGTFVLDFRNDAEAVRDEFEPWFGKTVAPPTDPNLLYDTRRELDEHDVLRADEIEAVVGLLLSARGSDDKVSARVHAALGPAVDRVHALADDDRNRFRAALTRFVRIYSFLSQVVSFSDVKLERDYLFCRALAALVRDAGVGGLDLGSAVELTHLRVQQTFEGSVALEAGDGEVSTIFSGAGPRRLPDEEPLSKIIAELNSRFGTNFDPRDRVFFDVVAAKLADRPDIQLLAANNPAQQFGLAVEKEFTQGVVDQLQVAEDIALAYVDNAELKRMVLDVYAPLLQSRAKVANQEHAPVGDLLGPDRESTTLEYKASLRTHAASGELYRPLETASVKTVAAFLNSELGGTLLLGVADDGTPVGLAGDYATLRKAGRDDRDLFTLHLANILTQALGAAAASQVRVTMHIVDGHDLCRAHVLPSAVPVEATVTIETKAGLEKKTAFYIRVLNGTREITDPAERDRYIAGRWPAGGATG